MLTELFDYALPPQRIAQRPPDERDGARLLVVGESACEHHWVRQWPELVPRGAVVVLNDSRVLKARLLCHKQDTGGRVELLLLEPAAGGLPGRERWHALGHANRPLRAGTRLQLGAAEIEVLGSAEQGVLEVEIRHTQGVSALLEAHGQVPLPPYIERAADGEDARRYQTVFATHDGSVAAPTAGLHITQAMLARLRERQLLVHSVTLHVGMGTFRPVSVPDLDQHPMHVESFEVSPELQQAVNCARDEGRPVVAVGTTVVRALESAAVQGRLRAGAAHTRLLIQPGYRFQVVDALLTNFHAPRSTLLALVSAFAGLETIRNAYSTALDAEYRFLSYGDAMWLPRRAEWAP